MARIERLVSSVPMQVTASPGPQLRDAMPGAIQGLGGGLAQLGGALVEREQRRLEMEDTQQFRQLQTDLDAAMFDAEQNMPAGGRGFSEGFRSGALTELTQAYLSSIEDEDLRARREADIGLLFDQRGLRADRAEYQELVSFQSGVLTDVGNDALAMIAANPDSIEDVQEDYEARVRGSNLPPADQEEMIRNADGLFASGYLESIASDPLRVMYETGGTPMELPVDTRAALLTGALEDWALGPGRSGERVGEFGLRREDLSAIAQREGIDPASQPGGWEAYLSNPTRARMLAQSQMEYLMTEAGFEDPVDAVVAFYMGEEFANGDWSRGDLPRGVQSALRQALPDFMTGSPGIPLTSSIPLTDGAGNALPESRYDEIDPQLVQIARNVFAQFGYDSLPILDAERADNAGYGASNSQHVLRREDGTPTGRRGAIDISVAQLSTPQRVQLLEALSTAGVTGIGVYNGNFIHLDFGDRRAWGNQLADGSWGPVPSWATEVVGRHVRGEIDSVTLNPMGGVNPRVSGAAAGDILAARQGAIESLTDTATPTAQMRADAQTFLDDSLAAFRVGEDLPMRSVLEDALNALTPPNAQTYRDRITEETAVAALTENIDEMDAAELTGLLNQVESPAMPYRGTDVGETIYDRTVAAVEEEQQYRLREPANAAHRDPDLAALWDGLTINMVSGVPVPQVADQQDGRSTFRDYIEASTRIQRERFGLSDAAAQTLPNRTLAEMAQHVAAITRNPDIPPEEVTEQMAVFANRMVWIFGDRADDVLVDVLGFMQGDTGEGTPEATLTRRLTRTMRDANVDTGPLSAVREGGGADDTVFLVDATLDDVTEEDLNRQALQLQALPEGERVAALNRIADPETRAAVRGRLP